MSSERFVPIPEAHGHNGRMSFDISLPGGVKISKLTVDVDRTANAMDMGGISTLSIRSIETRNRGYSAPNSVENDGSATLGLTLVDAKVETKEILQIPGEAPWRNFQWVHLKTTIDVEQIDRRMGNLDDSKKEAAWAKILDTHLRRSIRSAGIKHLLSGFDGTQRAFAFALSSGYFGVLMDVIIPTVNDPLFQSFHDNAIRNLVIGQTLSTVIGAWVGRELGGNEKDGQGYRLNFIPGLELDRALVLLVASSRPNSFIKVNSG